MRPTLFKIGPVPIRGYGLMIAICFLVAIYVAARRAKKEGMLPQTIFDLGLYILISALIGARILHALQHPGSYESFLDFLKVWEGGLSYYGGFILALLVSIFYIRGKKLSVAKISDIVAPSVMLGFSIGRIGCFLAGCCFGKPTSLPWGVTFPEGSLAWMELGSQKIHPTQIYDSILLFSIFIILIAVRKYMKFPGQLFLFSVIIYSVSRFSIDFLRYYSPEERVGSLADSQVISIIAGVTSLIFMIVISRRQIVKTNPVKFDRPKAGRRDS